MDDKRTYTVYISVHRKRKLDLCNTRHVGLWWVPEEGSPHHYYHVRDQEGEFRFQYRLNFNPTSSRTFAKKIEVGKIIRPILFSELEAQMKSVAVANDDPEFNCQLWVDYALQALVKGGYLSPKQYDDGMDGMIDAIMEAEHEDIA